jgi:hypothetical protein
VAANKQQESKSLIPIMSTKSLNLLRISLIIVFLLLFALPFFPFPLTHVIILLDYFSLINSFTNSLVTSYHEKLLNKLPLQPEQSIPFLFQHNVTKELFYEVSRGYTFPVVIKGWNGNEANEDSFDAMKIWKNIDWWIENYGNETVLCKDISDGIAVNSCTISDALSSSEVGAEARGNLAREGNDDDQKAKQVKYYVVGEAKLFQKYPELEVMLRSNVTKNELAPGKHIFTQLFMGYGGMGSDVHSALGCNLFHQVVGKKKWWVFPPSQTPYLLPSLNKNGLSVYTLTRLGSGKANTEPSPWLSKLERYTAILEPGDILFDAPWFWHGVENIGNQDDLVIGVASRYMTPLFSSSFKNNWLLTAIGIFSIAKDFGLKKFLSSPDSFQQSLETSRNIQANRAKNEAK